MNICVKLETLARLECLRVKSSTFLFENANVDVTDTRYAHDSYTAKNGSSKILATSDETYMYLVYWI